MTGRAPDLATTRDLARAYRRFGEVDAASSRLYRRVAVALSESDAALRVLAVAPARSRRPALILAALHDLALAGRAPSLAAAYAGRDAGGDAGAAAIEVLVTQADAVLHHARRRRTRVVGTTRCAVLYPAVTEAVRRAGAGAVGLVGVGASLGLDLHVDRVGVTYDTGATLGDPASPVQLSSSVVGQRPVPAGSMPDVVARIGVDPDPLDPTDPDDARWLRACVWPDDHVRRAGLDAELALVAGAPPRLLRGDAVETLPAAVAAVPAEALPVVVTSWALSDVPREGRRRFLQHLDDMAAHRPVAWVSLEGVGVAPGVPTLGDRHASGHSIVGVTMLDGATRRAEAVGRCWSRGRWLTWLADP